MTTLKIGLLLGDEDDWPSAFEALHRRWAPKIKYRGETFDFDVERVRIHPFSLRAPTSYHLVIDRLAYWHFTPREWLKKAAMVNRVYLLNNPFTFQAMEKHSAYCAMIRLGLPIPETWLIIPKRGPAGRKYEITAQRYHDMFDLPAIARGIGFPMYMKPFDGGGWRGVSRIENEWGLMNAYDHSGETVMHLQRGLDNFDVFVRALAIGPQVRTMKYDPLQPHHARYQIASGFLDDAHAREARITVKLINAFFRWEFNSCESILKDGVLSPIDFANACPDIAVNSLHYHFAWSIKSLMLWSVFCLVAKRKMRINLDVEKFFEIGDSDRTYDEKLTEYERLADEYFMAEEFEAFRAEHQAAVDEAFWDYVNAPEFDDMLRLVVRNTFPDHEHEPFFSHFKGLMNRWSMDEKPAGR